MKSFSELTSASQVNNEDLLAISQTSGSGYASKKTTVKDITDKSNLNLAEEYDSTSTYAVDDYVIYESVLYKCIGTTTGTFDSTKWTSVVVTDEMGSGGGTGGHTIIDENGNSMTARAGLQFVGANVDDDATNNKTIVDVASAGGIDGVFPDLSNDLGITFTFDSTQHTWEATEDCAIGWNLIAIDSGTGAYIDIIDGANSLRVFNSYEYQHGAGGWALVKKGQTVSYRAKASTSGGGFVSSMKAYGIQTGTTHSKFQPVIYSLEERVIGVWKDGRPLYQKTVDFGALPNNTTKTVSYNISDLDYFVMIQGIAHNQNGTRNIPFVDDAVKTSDVLLDTIKSSGVIRIIAHTDLSSLTGEVTLQYVKTTDVAGSGSWTPQGVPTHHYSTDEQIIGTWNGETFYERMFEVSHTFTQGDNDIELQSNVDFVSSDIKTYDATTVLSNGSVSKRISVLPDDTLYVNSSNKLILYFNCTNPSSVGTRTVRVVAQYTKSS